MNENDEGNDDISSLGETLTKKTLGVIGFGKVGFAVAKRLKQLGISKIIYNDLYPISTATEVEADLVPFSQILTQSDIVCVCCKSTSKTKHLFKKDTFHSMKTSAILINASHGEVINYVDLYEALRNDSITAAGLDVRGQDMIPYKHPLSGLRNCFFSPVRESTSRDARGKISMAVAKNILRALTERIHAPDVNGLITMGPCQ